MAGAIASYRRRLPAATLLVVAFSLCASADQSEQMAFFESRIRPVLVEHCYECHSASAKQIEGGLQLDSRVGIRAGGDRGPAIVPGEEGASLLLRALAYDELEMPPDGKLPAHIIADFQKWVRIGAPDPREQAPIEPTGAHDSRGRDFWAFQPVTRTQLPTVENPHWPKTAIDYYILAGLEGASLQPAAPGTRAQLIRRLCFDLLGLPPTPSQVHAFVHDTTPEAYERLVDSLLASPHYGERWGQHWLDVVRYAETEGFEYDRLLQGAWRYRDYVIDSFNADKPYDQFMMEQLAGDEIAPDSPPHRIAAGFHRLGTVRRNAGNQQVASSRNEVLTERTDIVGATFLGLTIGCARCHDHKFDPISQHDYYGLQAFLAATREDNVLLLASAEQRDEWKQQTKRIDEEIARLKVIMANQSGADEEKTKARIQDLEGQRPPTLPTICSIKNDPDDVTPIHLLRRGDPELPGRQVTMRLPGAFASRQPGTSTSAPRTRLAHWLASPSHPLSPRVLANRLWQYHFGQGIVRTPNDFGNNGARPSHPELLDYLAELLTHSGWSIKAVHRQILLSSTYRQSSRSSLADRGQLVDPDNELLWRFPRRRLAAEEIRDAMLAIAGLLNDHAGGRSVTLPVDQQLVDQLYKPAQWEVTPDLSAHVRRSIYLLAKRNLRLPFMEVFDQPAAQTSCPNREQSTHAPQALELLNGSVSNAMAAAFARRLRDEIPGDVKGQVDQAYQLATGRRPSARESDLAVAFVQNVSLREFALAMFNLNDFLYVQ